MSERCSSRTRGLPISAPADPFEAQAARDALVEASGALKVVAVSLTKIASDLRLMGSGPRAGLAEIFLPELQKGSSIMPGKVNPVIPEVVTQVAAQVIGNDQAITVGGMSGQFELNVYVPLMARNLLQSIGLLASASRLLAEKCVDGIEANREQLERYAELTLSAATALNPYIGYDKAAEIVKEAAVIGPVAARGRARRRSGRRDPRRGARLPRDGQAARASSRWPRASRLTQARRDRLFTPSIGRIQRPTGRKARNTMRMHVPRRFVAALAVATVAAAVLASSAFAGGDPIVVQSSGTTSFAGKGLRRNASDRPDT